MTHGLFLVSAGRSSWRFEILSSLRTKDVIFGGAPLFHILEQTCSLSTVIVGVELSLIQPRVNLDAVFDSISRFKLPH